MFFTKIEKGSVTMTFVLFLVATNKYILQSISGHFSKHGSQVCFQYSQLHYQIWNIAWELAKLSSQFAYLSTEVMN